MCRRRRHRPGLLLLAHAALALAAATACTAASSSAAAHSGDTWAVIVSSSRYWLNYRHSANALAVYQAVRRLGLPDSRILLMLADQPGCSPRNVHPGQLYLSPGGRSAAGGGSTNNTCTGDDASGLPGNLLAGDVEVDYRGRETSVDALLRVLTGRHPAGTPASKRLGSGPSSRVLLYLTGHGGDEFLKFHDQEELLAADLAAAVRQMAAAGRYGELLLLADTCQASTLWSRITSPNVLGIASSKLGQSSYAHHIDTTIGQHVVDEVSFYLHQFLTTHVPAHPAAGPGSAGTGAGSSGGSSAGRVPSMQQLVNYISSQRLSSEVQVRTDLYPRALANVPVTHFFGAAGPAVRPTGAPAPTTQGSGAVGARSGGNAVEAAVGLLMAAVQQPDTASSGAAAPVANTHPRQPVPLFALLEAAGGSGGGSGSSDGMQAAVLVTVAWAAVALLAHRLLLPSM